MRGKPPPPGQEHARVLMILRVLIRSSRTCFVGGPSRFLGGGPGAQSLVRALIPTQEHCMRVQMITACSCFFGGLAKRAQRGRNCVRAMPGRGSMSSASPQHSLRGRRRVLWVCLGVVWFPAGLRSPVGPFDTAVAVAPPHPSGSRWTRTPTAAFRGLTPCATWACGEALPVPSYRVQTRSVGT